MEDTTKKGLFLLALIAASSIAAMAMRYQCDSGALYSHTSSDGSVLWVWTDGDTVITGSSPHIADGKGC